MTPNRLGTIAFRWSISAVFLLCVFVPKAQGQSAATAINSYHRNKGSVDISLLAHKPGLFSGSVLNLSGWANISSGDCNFLADTLPSTPMLASVRRTESASQKYESEIPGSSQPDSPDGGGQQCLESPY
jgi:hypothetical protein